MDDYDYACMYGEDGNFSTRYGDKSNLSFIGPICLHCFFFYMLTPLLYSVGGGLRGCRVRRTTKAKRSKAKQSDHSCWTHKTRCPTLQQYFCPPRHQLGFCLSNYILWRPKAGPRQLLCKVCTAPHRNNRACNPSDPTQAAYPEPAATRSWYRLHTVQAQDIGIGTGEGPFTATAAICT